MWLVLSEIAFHKKSAKNSKTAYWKVTLKFVKTLLTGFMASMEYIHICIWILMHPDWTYPQNLQSLIFAAQNQQYCNKNWYLDLQKVAACSNPWWLILLWVVTNIRRIHIDNGSESFKFAKMCSPFNTLPTRLALRKQMLVISLALTKDIEQ